MTPEMDETSSSNQSSINNSNNNSQTSANTIGGTNTNSGHGNNNSNDEDPLSARDQHFLWAQLTEEQLNRYEMFRRSTFPKASIKRLMQTLTGSSISQNVVIAMSGIAKVFVGELVEEAVRIQARYGESGPVEPKHLREAYRVIRHRSDKAVKIA